MRESDNHTNAGRDRETGEGRQTDKEGMRQTDRQTNAGRERETDRGSVDYIKSMCNIMAKL